MLSLKQIYDLLVTCDMFEFEIQWEISYAKNYDSYRHFPGARGPGPKSSNSSPSIGLVSQVGRAHKRCSLR